MEFIMLNSREDDQPTNSLIEKKQEVNNYECMYCKHGFTNAQALGGHMNVHRKHRATKKINYSSSSNNNINKQQQHHHLQGEQTLDYLMLTSSSPAAANYGTTTPAAAASPQGEEVVTSLSLSLHFERWSHHHHHHQEEESIDEVVDLELRLGN